MHVENIKKLRRAFLHNIHDGPSSLSNGRFLFPLRGDKSCTRHVPLCHGGSTHPGQSVHILGDGAIATGIGVKEVNTTGEGLEMVVAVSSSGLSEEVVPGRHNDTPTRRLGRPKDATLKLLAKRRGSSRRAPNKAIPVASLQS